MKNKLFKDKNFLLLMLGKLVSLVGSDMQNFALSLYILKVTGSATKFASVLSITVLPRIILAPIAGVFTDWFDRKKIIVSFDMINGIIIGIYAFIFFYAGQLSMISVYILAVILSITSTIFQPAISTVIPSIVDKEQLVDANGVNSMVMSLGSLVAPMLAGILLSRYDLFIVLLINFISFILSSISEMFIDIPKHNNTPEKINYQSFKKDFVIGLNYIKNTRIIIIFIYIVMIVNFAFNPLFNIGVIYICKEILCISDYQYGLMQTILVASMFISPVLCTYISKKISLGRILTNSILLICTLCLFIAITSMEVFRELFLTNIVPFIIIVFVCFLVGVILGVINISLGVAIQKNVTLDKLGRVNTVMSTASMCIIPLGTMFFGYLYDVLPAWICVLISVLIMFVSISIFRKSILRAEKNVLLESQPNTD